MRIFTYVLHQDGVADDTALELMAAAKQIDPAASPIALVSGAGAEVDRVCETLRTSYAEVWKFSHEALAGCNGEAVRQALLKELPAGSIVLLAHEHFGIDLAPGLSIKLNAACVPDVLSIDAGKPGSLRLVRQEFGGQVSTHVQCDLSSGAVISIRPGAFKAEQSGELDGQVIDKSSGIGSLALKRRYLETVVPESGDVDITKHAVLVSIGRGIQEQDNVPIAEELAEALGGALSCSRPVVDAKWLEKSRQVGSSGKTVKPKVYMALGISGSFQHLAGLKGNPFIVAVNKNPKAPIFQVADVGIVDDILEFIPAMTQRLQEVASGKLATAKA